MDNKILDFVRNVILGDEASYELKAAALDLYVESVNSVPRRAALAPLPVGFPAGYLLREEDFDVVQNYLDKGMKINAIKHLRSVCQSENGIVPGLKDTKDCVDAWPSKYPYDSYRVNNY